MTAVPLRVCCFPLHLRENEVLDIVYGAMPRQAYALTPYRWLWSAFARTDIFHVHWPDAVVMGRSRMRTLLKFVAFAVSVTAFRLRRVPVVYSVHNVGSHEGRFPRLETALWSWFLPRVDAFIHMNSQSQTLLADRGRPAPGALHAVVPHPHYRAARRTATDRTAARTRLGLPPEAHVLLSVGLIRPYKGLEHLIAAFAGYADPAAVLVIAGRPVDAAYAGQVRALAARDPRVRLDLRFVPPDDVEAYLAASDAVVLAHRRLTNSGVAILALSHDRALIAPDCGAIADLKAQAGPAWVTTFGAAGLTAATIAEARASRAGLAADARPDLSPLDPERVAEGIGAVYARVHARSEGLSP